MNRFEQVFSDGHQMLLAREQAGENESMSSEIPLFMGYGYRDPREQTDTTENITFSQFRWSAVIGFYLLLHFYTH